MTSTNWEGGAEAVRHLLDLGHRRIGLLAGPRESLPAQQRLDGYLSALGRAGVPVDRSLIVHGKFREDDGRRGALELLALADPPTAVFAASDALAVGVLRAAGERGLAVPADLSVLGFDDTMITGWTTPPLTAVRQPLFEMGQVAVERLLALAADPEVFAPPFQLETRLVARESTGPAPQ
ncbi:LacI family DNA-binding transcriptional regulator [Brachybacterium squillarum]|uniref:LacI family DNA-binding transcriptional regulator n=1 Tax=Brachybacterium squillarum TaxID=661979 RepID=UPI002223D22F|nr:substrate-binding domain-containing protein [Brachybacterium squillarum]MCW1804529.1 substrate-binding domain-containing protein [Brachybacterium squillarum]